MAAADTAFERLLKKDRIGVLAGLLGVTALAWIYLIVLAADMEGMAGMAGAMDAAKAAAPGGRWSAADFALTFLMWAVMMVGMMLPSAAPMLMLFALVNRKRRAEGHTFVATGVFAAGYLAAWTGFSLLAAAAQWALHEATLLSPGMASTSAVLGGGLFVAAGVYQWTPLKHICLKHCRSPLHFIAVQWRSGAAGAFRMGLNHGAYCVGCCWILMGLLFALGVMNLLWVAVIAVFVLAEKIVPYGEWVARAGGGLMIAAGAYLALTG